MVLGLPKTYLRWGGCPRWHPTYFVGEQRALVHNTQCACLYGHTTPFSVMNSAERKAFQHSYSRHASEFGLPNWKQGDAVQLQQAFNKAVTNVRSSGTQFVGPIFKPWNGVSVEVNYFESTINGSRYYYYEDKVTGKFISSGLARP